MGQYGEDDHREDAPRFILLELRYKNVLKRSTFYDLYGYSNSKDHDELPTFLNGRVSFEIQFWNFDLRRWSANA